MIIRIPNCLPIIIEIISTFLHRILFWTDISTDPTRNSYIGSAFMDGTGMKKIVDTNVNSPNGIVIDYTGNLRHIQTDEYIII